MHRYQNFCFLIKFSVRTQYPRANPQNRGEKRRLMKQLIRRNNSHITRISGNVRNSDNLDFTRSAVASFLSKFRHFRDVLSFFGKEAREKRNGSHHHYRALMSFPESFSKECSSPRVAICFKDTVISTKRLFIIEIFVFNNLFWILFKEGFLADLFSSR